MVRKSALMESDRIFILLPFFWILGMFPCNSKELKITQPENKNISSTTTIQKIVNFEPDSTINKILGLNNSKSSVEFYPKISSKKLIEGIRESPVLGFNNISEEYLLLYLYEGGVKNEFSCFEIGYVKDLENTEKINTDYKVFETESGLKLGLSFEDLLKIKGEGYTTKGSKVIYRMDDYPNSSFLKRHNMPAYYLEVTLKKDKIAKILFGFEQP